MKRMAVAMILTIGTEVVATPQTEPRAARKGGESEARKAAQSSAYQETIYVPGPVDRRTRIKADGEECFAFGAVKICFCPPPRL